MRKGLFQAFGQTIEGAGFAILFVVRHISFCVIQKFADKRNDHAILKRQIGLKDVNIIVGFGCAVLFLMHPLLPFVAHELSAGQFSGAINGDRVALFDEIAGEFFVSNEGAVSNPTGTLRARRPV